MKNAFEWKCWIMKWILENVRRTKCDEETNNGVSCKCSNRLNEKEKPKKGDIHVEVIRSFVIISDYVRFEWNSKFMYSSVDGAACGQIEFQWRNSQAKTENQIVERRMANIFIFRGMKTTTKKKRTHQWTTEQQTILKRRTRMWWNANIFTSKNGVDKSFQLRFWFGTKPMMASTVTDSTMISQTATDDTGDGALLRHSTCCETVCEIEYRSQRSVAHSQWPRFPFRSSAVCRSDFSHSLLRFIFLPLFVSSLRCASPLTNERRLS